VSDIDPLLVRALERQLERRAEVLSSGAERVGWKLGMGQRERIGDGPVIGYLTSASRLESGQAYDCEGAEALHADAELALELGEDGRIVAYGAALELVDLGGSDEAAEIVAGNAFHRAVVFGAFHRTWAGGEGRLVVDGQIRDRAQVAGGYERLVARVGELLAVVGDALEPGDLVITGSIVQVPVASGDHVAPELTALGRAEIRLAEARPRFSPHPPGKKA
jgi:2-keto-4-pentenoate hydratase